MGREPFDAIKVNKISLSSKGVLVDCLVLPLFTVTEIKENMETSHESRDLVKEYEKKEQIVTFSDQNPASEVKHTPAPVTIPKHLSGTCEYRDHSIRDFLARPRNVVTFTWAAADAVGTVKMTSLCPDVLLTTLMNICKVRDFRFFRCNIQYAFKLNMNVMSVGRLTAFTYPQPAQIGDQINTTSLTNISGLQHANIEAGSSNVTMLEVPFVYRRSAYDFLNDVADPWATVGVVVYNALRSSSGSTSGSVAVWVAANKDTIELDVPTTQEIPVYPPPVTAGPMLFAQSTEAQINAESGAISSKIARASEVADTIANMGLGPVSEAAGAASWVTEILSKGLAAFGYSKPTNEQTIAPMVQQPARNYTHFNGDDNSVVMGADTRNAIKIETRVFGTKKDEMDIGYVISQPMFIETFSWSMSDTPGKVLRSWPVTPGFCPIAPVATQVESTYLSYVASLFQYWRGSLSYKLDFIANRFYQGTIGVAFLSGVYTAPATITLADIEAAPKVICQVTDSTDCTFVVPYNLATPFMEVQLGSRTSTGATFTYAGLNSPTVSAGTCIVYVVNTLTGPATIPSSIDVNLYISGCANTEFAIPSIPRYAPVPITLPSARQSKSKNSATMRAQSSKVPVGLNTAKGEEAAMQHIFLAKAEKPWDSSFHEISMGDAQFNLRQLTRMFSPMKEDALPDDNALTVDPSYFGWDLTDFTCNRLFRIARMYAYWRGSVRYKFIPDLPSGVVSPTFKVWTYSKGYSPPDVPAYDPAPYPAESNVGFSWVVNMAQTPFLEFSLPFYRNVYAELVSTDTATRRNKAQITTSLAGVSYSLLCAAGDDFTFGFLIPPPKMQLNT